MATSSRPAARIADAASLHDVPPQETLSMGFEMMEFARRLREAADRVQEH